MLCFASSDGCSCVWLCGGSLLPPSWRRSSFESLIMITVSSMFALPSIDSMAAWRSIRRCRALGSGRGRVGEGRDRSGSGTEDLGLRSSVGPLSPARAAGWSWQRQRRRQIHSSNTAFGILRTCATWLCFLFPFPSPRISFCGALSLTNVLPWAWLGLGLNYSLGSDLADSGELRLDAFMAP